MYLHSKIQGQGSPVLLIHGLFGSLDNLGYLARTLSQNHQVYQIDLPNHGQSERSDHTDYAFLANVIHQFLVSHNITRLSIIGHSMGGKVAMAFALEYPEFVDHLAVLDIAPVAYREDRHENVFKALNATQHTALSSRSQVDDLLAQYIKDAGTRQFLLKSLQRDENQHFAWRFNFPLLESHYHDIATWENPQQHVFNGNVLFLKGMNSDYLTNEYRDAILQQFPQAKVHVIANAGHWLHAEKPETIARVILQFLQKN